MLMDLFNLLQYRSGPINTAVLSREVASHVALISAAFQPEPPQPPKSIIPSSAFTTVSRISATVSTFIILLPLHPPAHGWPLFLEYLLYFRLTSAKAAAQGPAGTGGSDPHHVPSQREGSAGSVGHRGRARRPRRIHAEGRGQTVISHPRNSRGGTRVIRSRLLAFSLRRGILRIDCFIQVAWSKVAIAVCKVVDSLVFAATHIAPAAQRDPQPLVQTWQSLVELTTRILFLIKEGDDVTAAEVLSLETSLPLNLQPPLPCLLLYHTYIVRVYGSL